MSTHQAQHSNQQSLYDFILVGQGLAGSILAWNLIHAGASVLVIDEGHKDASSVVAAGIINPITGHRLNITDNIEHFLPNALELYKAMEQQFQTKLIHALPQLRLIKKSGQLDYWHQRKQQSSHQPYLGKLHPEHSAFSDSALGIAEIKQTYRVATGQLLQRCREWFLEHKALQNERFDYQSLHFNDSGVEYRSIQAKAVIFCEGFQTIHNPWWQHLPFKLAKGEILSLESDDLPSIMLNWGSWLLPTQQSNGSPLSPQAATKQVYKLGSNYVWNDVDLTPSVATKEHLLASMRSKVSTEAHVVDQQVGIRPTTLHRQAFVGAHTEQPQVFCFNGFGSKGCLTIPQHAQLLMNHLLHDAALPPHLTQYL